MDKTTLACALFALSAVSAAFGAATSTDDYVQDGLIAHWDAIDNQATGEHDGTATTWKDLKGAREFSLGGATWGENWLAFSSASGSGGTYNPTGDDLFAFTEADSNRTVEIVFEYYWGLVSYTSSSLFVGPSSSHILIARSAAVQAASAPRGIVATDHTEPVLMPTCRQGLTTLSFGYEKSGDTVVRKEGSLWLNGSSVAPSGSDWTSSYSQGSIVNIGRDNNGNNRFNGNFHSIRVYDRLLTEDEVKANQLVDARRFSEKTGRSFYVDADHGADDAAHDGTTEAKAKKTLAEALKLATEYGDTVWALPGTYDAGTAVDTDESTKYVQTNRCVVPAYVALKSTQGAAVTFIKGRKTSDATYGVGAESIRGVRLKTGATLVGFTVADAATCATDAGGGGIGGSPCSVVKDCVVTNCASRNGAVAQTANDDLKLMYVLRCELVDNKNPFSYSGSALGNSSYAVLNSWIHDNSGNCTYPGGGGACFFNCTVENPTRMVSGGAAYGTYFTESINDADTLSLYDCLFASQGVYDARVSKGYVKHGCEVGTDPVDGFDNELYEDRFRLLAGEYIHEANLAFGGVQRIYNRTVDYGGIEFDWRPTYSKDLAPQRVAVTNASAGVYETPEKKVALTDGEEFSVDWTAPTAGVNEYSFTALVTGEGSLLCRTNGVATPFATLTAADGEKTVAVNLAGSTAFRFAFSGAGEAVLSSFKDTIAINISIPNGGVKLTGIEAGETWVTPGTEKTFALERTYENDRLCTGFTVNDSDFVDFDDYPDGWTCTVSNKASAVSIVAQYKTVQDFYVDPVNGSDAACGFQTNRAWKTLATVKTNGNVRSGDVVYLFPGRYREGALGLTDSSVTSNRVIVPAGVTLRALSPKGAQETFVCGADAPEGDANGCGDGAVRCAYLEDGGAIHGVTLTGGRTAVASTTDGYYAAAYANYTDGDAVGACVDCVISNNIANWCAGGTGLRYVRCRISENKGYNWCSIFQDGWFYNCLVRDNVGTYCFYTPKGIYNCTLLSGAHVHAPNQYSYLYNSVVWSVTGCTLNYCAYGSCNENTQLVAGNRQVAMSTLDFDAEGHCDAEVLRNFGLNSYVSSIPEDYRGVDRDGVQRIYDGTVDAGAYEYDVRPDLRAALGRRVTSVTDASEQVLLENGTVRLSGDAATLGAIAKGGRVVMPVTLDGGSLAVSVNGTEAAVLAATGSVALTLQPGDVVEFAYTGTGSAVLARFAGPGLAVILR